MLIVGKQQPAGRNSATFWWLCLMQWLWSLELRYDTIAYVIKFALKHW